MSSHANPITACAQRNPEQVFGPNLSAELKRQGLTSRTLAKRVGCSESQISRWTRGQGTPSFSRLIAIREALGCSWDVLLGEGDS